MTSPEPPPPTPVLEAFTSYQRTAAMQAAVGLDVFTAVGAGAGTAEELAVRCGASARGLRALANHLVVHGFLAKKGGRFLTTPVAARWLDRRSPEYLGDALTFLASDTLRAAFDGLLEAVRRGGAPPGGGTTSRENPVWTAFARGLDPVVRPRARAVAGILLSPEAPPPRRVLDVAAGHGLFGIELLLRVPGARCTALDWPAVLEVAREKADAAGLADRFTTLPGSALEIDWGTGHDLVLMANFLHHFDRPTCIALLERARAALSAGGRVAVLEPVPDEDRTTPPEPAVFDLVMLATTPSGEAYTLREYGGMFAAAGLSPPVPHQIPDAPQLVLVAGAGGDGRSAR